MYHAAGVWDRDSIRRLGLDHRLETHENWRQGKKDSYSRYPAGNYLWDNLEDAESYFCDDERDIWEVDVRGLALIPDPARIAAAEALHPLFKHSFCSLEPIGPERVTLLEPAGTYIAFLLKYQEQSRLSK
jgi:hypothetical protein